MFDLTVRVEACLVLARERADGAFGAGGVCGDRRRSRRCAAHRGLGRVDREWCGPAGDVSVRLNLSNDARGLERPVDRVHPSGTRRHLTPPTSVCVCVCVQLPSFFFLLASTILRISAADGGLGPSGG